MTVHKIVEKYLKENEYDGLYSEDFDCGCPIHDLFPCETDLKTLCKPGYKRLMDDGDWGIFKEKEEPK